MDVLKLKNKVAIVTGGASGIGKSCCEGLAEVGTCVVIADMNEDLGKRTVNELIEDLKNKKIDAAILEKPVAESYVLRNKNLINIECHTGAYDALLGSAIAVKKGNKDLLMAVNKILKKLKQENKIAEFVEDARILMNK